MPNFIAHGFQTPNVLVLYHCIRVPETLGRPSGAIPLTRAIREVCDRVKVQGMRGTGKDGRCREDEYANELCHLSLWSGGNSANSWAPGAVEGGQRPKGRTGLGCWRHLMEVSFSVGVNELISRILKVEDGAYLMSPKNPQLPWHPRSCLLSWKKWAGRWPPIT